MRPFNELLYGRQKEDSKNLLNSLWNSIFSWRKKDYEKNIEIITEPMKIYRVALDTSMNQLNNNSEKPSVILKRCEGARGILYMNETSNYLYLPHSILKRTRIIEVKDVSMKIRVYDGEVVNQLIYLENILGFLKEVD